MSHRSPPPLTALDREALAVLLACAPELPDDVLADLLTLAEHDPLLRQAVAEERRRRGEG